MCYYLHTSYASFKKLTAEKKKICNKNDRSKKIKVKVKTDLVNLTVFSKCVIYDNQNYKKLDKINNLEEFYPFRYHEQITHACTDHDDNDHTSTMTYFLSKCYQQNNHILTLHNSRRSCMYTKKKFSNFNFLCSIIILCTQSFFSADVTHLDFSVTVLAYS